MTRSFALKTYKILIVEDEVIPAHFMRKILEYHGHTVLGIAKDKEDALRYVDMAPDLLLMDIKIKGDADGIEVVKAFYALMNVAVIYLSAYSDERLLERANKTHPIGYLVKPVQEQTLISTIAVCMSNYMEEKSENLTTLTASSTFNSSKRLITEHGQIQLLTQRESLCLEMLIKHKDKLMSYEELESSIWFNEVPKESALRTLVWRLRKKLPLGVEIENLYNSGYKINF